MKLYEIEGKRPRISPDVAYIAEDVVIIGDVEIAEDVTIFPGVVLEGHPIKIKIGKGSNIQSGTVVHGNAGIDTIIGEYNTIGHSCIIHGCQLGNNVTVGIGSTVMAYSKIDENCFIGAGSLVTQRKHFERNSLIMGSPAKKVRDLKDNEIEEALNIAHMYIEEGRKIAVEIKRIN